MSTLAIPPLVVQHSYTGLRGAIVSTVEIGIMRWELVIEIEPEERFHSDSLGNCVFHTSLPSRRSNL